MTTADTSKAMEVENQIHRIMVERVTAACEHLTQALKANAPKRTGKMAAGIDYRVTEKGSLIRGKVKIPFPARFVEYGHLAPNGTRVPGKMFARKTWLSEHDRLSSILEGK